VRQKERETKPSRRLVRTKRGELRNYFPNNVSFLVSLFWGAMGTTFFSASLFASPPSFEEEG